MTGTARVSTECAASGEESIIVTVRGRLDAATAVELESVVRELVDKGAPGLDIDLRDVSDWSEAGADGLVRCHRLAARLADGLRYRTGRGPGQEALLAAYANLDTSPTD
jgi:anti-anti-sigma regulatory factor